MKTERKNTSRTGTSQLDILLDSFSKKQDNLNQDKNLTESSIKRNSHKRNTLSGNILSSELKNRIET